MEPNNQEPAEDPKLSSQKGYGKRPLWHWIIVYIVIAIIIYGLIYLIFFHNNGNSSNSSSY